MSSQELPHGLYEEVVTERLRQRLLRAAESTPQLAELDGAEAHVALGQYVGQMVTKALKALPRTDQVASQLSLVNRILDTVHDVIPKAADSEDHVRSEVLQALVAANASFPPRPGIPLSQSDLLVNARDEYRIGHELVQEIKSADRVDLICSFIKWGGVRLLRDVLEEYLGQGRPMRVITTTYLGSTDQKALDYLLDLGAKIRVSYDTRRTRLHAKAWLLHRDSGFSTAYIGSSNLSSTAQTDGLEWNVRVSTVDAARVVKKFEATFNNYWDDGEFEPYDGSPEQNEAFSRAIRQERAPDDPDLPISFFDVRPYPFQAEILDKLEAEREVHGRHRNLVIAATGTGKTVVAGLDYKRLRKSGAAESLLFVAHRREILKQSRLMFRHILRDGSFGELLVGGHRPEEDKHVFASVQSLAQLDLAKLDPKAFDMVIVDEFHHSAAPTYERFLNHLKPTVLLGLTATPERADGKSVRHWFDDHVAAELRVWDAIERGLLVPFHYFGIHDNTDLSQIQWRQGRYDVSELENLYTGDTLRANIVLQSLQDQVRSIAEIRALGFCVSKKHAAFMAAAFAAAGVPSMALTADTPREERDQAIAKLRRREIKVVFSVDLFNEGVDIPEVDTVLFLRPTESATVFIQQLGRGLRLHEDKECLTVLDFVGNATKEYRFDARFGSLLEMGRGRIKEQVEKGFPLLPSGCSIRLDRQSREIVLENLRQAVGTNKRSLVSELRRLGSDMSLAKFLTETGLTLEDVYRGGRFFADIRRAAGASVPEEGPDEDRLGRGISRLLHLDDPSWIRACLGLLEAGEWQGYSERGRAMFLVTLFGTEAYEDLRAAHEQLMAHPAIVAEIGEVFELLLDGIDHVPTPFDQVPEVPLQVHCRYSLDQIVAGFDLVKNGKLFRPREGVVFDEQSMCNLLFVTINKAESDYSPSTMYEDYALSSTEFHWQSQATTRPDGIKGQRHWQHRELGVTPLLFVREARKTDHGATAPYFFLGPVECSYHSGERPMNVTWRLGRAIPGDWLRRLRVA